MLLNRPLPGLILIQRSYEAHSLLWGPKPLLCLLGTLLDFLTVSGQSVHLLLVNTC